MAANPDLSKSVKQGVLTFNHEPINIVRQATIYDTPWIFVYDISPESMKLYNKTKDASVLAISTMKVAHKTVPLNPKVKSPLLKYVKDKDIVKGKQYYRVNEALPMYFNALEAGTDTFSGFFEDGWYELSKAYEKGNSVFLQTGVFIGIRHVTWIKNYIPLDGTIESLVMILAKSGIVL